MPAYVQTVRPEVEVIMPMPTDRNTEPSFIYAVLAVLVIICMSIVSRCTKPMMNNVLKDMKLQEIEVAFSEIQHPGQTERITLQKAAGLLTDSSKSCDFFVGEVRSYSDNQDQILAYYAGQKVKSDGEIRVIFIEDKTIPVANKPDLPDAFNALSQWNIDPTRLEQPLYIVFVFLREYDKNIECR
jgi:hypothetical protein